jgi:glutamate synthase (NADPH/NADH) small chain
VTLVLGADEVTMFYRRGKEALSASGVEQEWAQTHGVNLRLWAAPQEVLVRDGKVIGIRMASTRMEDGRLQMTQEVFDVPADMVLKAIGQTYVGTPAGAVIALRDGRIDTDAQGQPVRS